MEMLVVIALITVLMAMLLPAIGNTREAGRLVICRSNLRQYTVGMASYANDNDGKIMKTVEQWGDRPYPEYIRRDTTLDAAYDGEWGINLIKPYVDFADDPLQEMFGVAMCPSIDADLLMKFIKVRNFANNFSFLEYQYCYYGRVDMLEDNDLIGTAAQDLTGNNLEAGRILVSDILYHDASDKAWRYNHGPNGWAFNEYSWLPWDKGPQPNISGVNQGYGDGHVEWKPKDQFPYLEKMNNPATYPGGAMGRVGNNGDTFYY
jgi:hypothetical protein